MPNAARNYQGMAAPQDGPFSEYLKPYQPRAIDRVPPPGSATGYEATPAAAGNLALQFLQGIRQERMARAMEQDANVEKQTNTYRDIVSGHLGPDSDLTQEAREKLHAHANDVMVQHMQQQMNDIPKGNGLLGGIKNVFVALSGGPIKVREPLDWTTERGRLDELLRTPGYNQKDNYLATVKEASSAVDALKAQNPYPTQDQVQGVLRPMFAKMVSSAPKYLAEFQATVGVPMGASYPASGSVEAMMNDLTRMRQQRNQPGAAAPGVPSGPPTTPPPPAQATPTAQAMYPEMIDQSMATQGLMANDPRQAPPLVRPADTGAPQTAQARASAAAADPNAIQYAEGSSPEMFSMLSRIAGMPKSPIQVSQPTPVMVHMPNGRGVRTMASVVMGASPDDNGYWDANTMRKIANPVTRESLEAASAWPDDQGYMRQIGPDGTVGYVLDKEGNKVRKGYGLVGAVDPNTGQVTNQTRWDAAGRPTAGQGLQTERTAEEIKRIRGERFAENDKLRDQRFGQIERDTAQWMTDIQRGQLSIAAQNAMLMGGLSQQDIDAAIKSNPKSLYEFLGGYRDRAVKAAQEAWLNGGHSVEQNFPMPARQGTPAAAAPSTPTTKTDAPPPPPRSGAVPVPSAQAQQSLWKK